jgi:hypothetical protein
MTYAEQSELIRQIRRLESANRRWKVAVMGVIGALAVALTANAYAFSEKQAAEGARQEVKAADVEVPSNMPTYYANFYRVTGTPEELVLEFGFNRNFGQKQTEPVKLSNQVIMNFYTAKRLLTALQFAVAQHEKFFGTLEIDVRKRLKPGAEGACK